MKLFTKFKLAMTLAAGITMAASSAQAASGNFITIGTGGVTGVYYPLGGASAVL